MAAPVPEVFWGGRCNADRTEPHVKGLQMKRAAIAFALLAMLPLAVCAGVNPQVLPLQGALSQQTMTRLMLTDAARIGGRVVAVGDRGYIVYSDDDGKNWQRAATPPNLPMLTGVYFSDQKTGWVVGHDAYILKSEDQGQTWKQVFAAASEQKPLMDIVFVDAGTGFAVGTYGSFYETTDGGNTWNPKKILTPAPAAKGKAAQEPKAPDDDKHFNAIIKVSDGHLLIAGEAGTLLKSDDNGKSWTRLVSPYKGSYFGAVRADDGAVLIFGMRGKIFRADAGLKSWTPIDNKSLASLMGSTRLPDGAIVLAGLSGTVLVSRDQGRSFQPLPTGTIKAYAAPLLGAPNALLLMGEAGAREVPLPSAPKPQ